MLHEIVASRDMHILLQDVFLKEIKHVFEKEKSMELEITGDYYDEKTLREEMNVSEHRD